MNKPPAFFQTLNLSDLTFSVGKSDIICVKRKIQYSLYFPIFLLCAKTSFNANISQISSKFKFSLPSVTI